MRRTDNSLFALAMGAAIALVLATGMARADTHWTNSNGGTFSTAANWDNGVPAAGVPTWYGLSGASYTVNFGANGNSGVLNATGQNQVVTFDLGGNTYTLNSYFYPANGNNGVAAPGSTNDSVKMIIENGTLSTPQATYIAYIFGVSGTGVVEIANSGHLQDAGAGAYFIMGDNAHSNAFVTVNGTGSTLNFAPTGAGYAALSGTFTVTNGGFASFSEGTATLPNIGAENSTQPALPQFLVTDVGSTSLWKGAVSSGAYTGVSADPNKYGGQVRVLNGGVILADAEVRFGATLIAANTNTIIVGGGTGTSVFQAGKITIGNAGNTGISTLTINPGGLVIATNPSAASIGLDDKTTLTLNGGAIQVAGGGALALQKLAVSTNQALLRGSGTISRYGAGNNFAINNFGRIRPGDTNATPVFGALTIQNGNLIQTNTALPTAGLNFDFSDTAYDQINISGGLARLTAGSNVFTLAAGSAPFVHGVKWGLGVYDFVIGTNVTSTPQYDNLVNLLTNTYHLTYSVDFQYGVVNLGAGLFALELSFVPEPSTVLLLVLGGLLVWRRISKRARKAVPTGTMGLIIALALVAGPARADEVWTNGNGGTFSTAGNWNPNTVPTAGVPVWFGLSGASYTVNFGANATSGQLNVTGQNQVVTFNLGGNTYNLSGGNSFYAGDTGTISDNIKVIINNGTISTPSGFWFNYLANSGTGIVEISNSGHVQDPFYFVVGDNARSNATVIVNGTGSTLEFAPSGAGYASLGGTLIVTNGGFASFSVGPGGATPIAGAENSTPAALPQIIVTGVGSTNLWKGAIASGALSGITADPERYGGELRVVDGGVLLADKVVVIGRTGYDARDTNTVVVGGGAGTSVLQAGGFVLGNNGTGNFTILNVNSGGMLIATNASSTTNGVAIPALGLNDKTILTLSNGAIQVAAGGSLALQKLGASGPLTNATLRGSGTISRFGAGSNFTISNNGRIRPGDTSTTSGLGALAVINGNLIQTNTANPTAGMNFEFSNTGLDQINISAGFARITAGSNVFALASGAPAPLPGVKYGLGTYDFVIGTNVVSTPQYDNLVNLLTNTYHLTYGVDFQYGVVNLGSGLFALELSFVPEPSTVLLLALGGLLVWRRMAKRRVARVK